MAARRPIGTSTPAVEGVSSLKEEDEVEGRAQTWHKRRGAEEVEVSGFRDVGSVDLSSFPFLSNSLLCLSLVPQTAPVSRRILAPDSLLRVVAGQVRGERPFQGKSPLKGFERGRPPQGVSWPGPGVCS